jgi:glyoxylase-like metal-dependent hydrolase (beta-lactamase superfamily II)
MPWIGVLCCGDYISPVEIPMISPGGSLAAYQATLARLATLVEQAETVVPGHGGPLSADQARRLLREDAAYLKALARNGDAAQLPPGRATSAQQRIHAENAGRATEE